MLIIALVNSEIRSQKIRYWAATEMPADPDGEEEAGL